LAAPVRPETPSNCVGQRSVRFRTSSPCYWGCRASACCVCRASVWISRCPRQQGLRGPPCVPGQTTRSSSPRAPVCVPHQQAGSCSGGNGSAIGSPCSQGARRGFWLRTHNWRRCRPRRARRRKQAWSGGVIDLPAGLAELHASFRSLLPLQRCWPDPTDSTETPPRQLDRSKAQWKGRCAAHRL